MIDNRQVLELPVTKVVQELDYKGQIRTTYVMDRGERGELEMFNTKQKLLESL